MNRSKAAREKRRKEAEERNLAYRHLSKKGKLAQLDDHPDGRQGAKKQRRKIEE